MKLIINSDSFSVSDVAFQGDMCKQETEGKYIIYDSDSSDYIKSINGVTASGGAFHLLDSTCISIVESDANGVYSDSISLAENELAIFDGCQACSTCKQLAVTSIELTKLELINLAIKNNVIYKAEDSQDLWEKLNQDYKKNLPFIGKNCPQCSEALQLPLKVNYLLYRYRALVNLWNYLVKIGSNQAVIQRAPQVQNGLVVTVKKAVDLCSLEGTQPVKLTVHVKLKKNEATTDGATYFTAVTTPKQNSCIVDDPSSSPVIEVDVQDNVVVSATFTYSLQKVKKSALLGQLKVLPVLASQTQIEEQKLTTPGITLAQYSALNRKATRTTSLQDSAVILIKGTQTMLWEVQWTWQVPQLKTVTQTKYFTTGACLLPEE